MSPLPALLLALLAPCARAGVISFDAGPDSGAIFSGDGYHVARLVNDGRWDIWLVDGKVRARGKTGTLPGGGVLSADGSRLLHLMTVADQKGRPLGVAAALNGRRAGKTYPEIRSLTLSPAGRNAAYVVKTPEGWAVASGQGLGPAFPDPPSAPTVTENGVAYFAQWQGAVWLYRNHKPVSRVAGTEVSLSPDLKRVGAVVRDRAAGTFVEVDGVRYGPYANASAPVFSRGGRHWAALASSVGSEPGGFNAIVADGRPGAAASCASCSLLVDDAGRAFQDVILVSISDEAQMHTCYLDGKELRSGGRPPRVGLLAGGAHYVYPMLTGRGVGVGFDGRELEWGVPLPLPNAPVEFDGPREYHYWSFEGTLRLVCGTVDGSDPKLSRCAARVRGVFAPAE